MLRLYTRREPPLCVLRGHRHAGEPALPARQPQPVGARDQVSQQLDELLVVHVQRGGE